MKLIMMLTLIFQLLTQSPASEAANDFNNKVNSGYESYIVIKEESHDFYNLKIIQGINDNKISFGVMLFNHNSKSHTVVVTVDNKQYNLPTNNRGDYIVPAIKYSKNITINIANENSIKPIAEINYMTPDQFSSANENIFIGDNKGLKMVSLTGSSIDLRDVGTISMIFVGVIVVTGFIIFIVYKKRKGIFSEQKRRENVFDFREHAQMYTVIQSDDEVMYSNERLNRVASNEDNEQTQDQQAYVRQRFYEEEVEDFIDVQKILKDKGFNTDYDNSLEYEKNEVMMELMKMRDLKEISQTQYREETIKLWKK